ncbi:MAG: hypothetical protein MUO54_07490 [Anaerolineales bacterium]|nr:hypothetical protein [Anaerolineales bacterium]
MGRYQQYQRDIKDTEKRVHPIWRGIGFLLMGLTVIMSYAGANLLVEANKTKEWITVPYGIRGGVYWAPDLYAELILTFFLIMIGFGVITIVYSLIYKVTRPQDLFKLLK